ncbi:MAG TPA: hypothetical protein VJN18_25500 [Polyangiaceae bacterium]|nr:hypothetical protein [Polyangiaceae bacterium]
MGDLAYVLHQGSNWVGIFDAYKIQDLVRYLLELDDVTETEPADEGETSGGGCSMSAPRGSLATWLALCLLGALRLRRLRRRNPEPAEPLTALPATWTAIHNLAAFLRMGHVRKAMDQPARRASGQGSMLVCRSPGLDLSEIRLRREAAVNRSSILVAKV